MPRLDSIEWAREHPDRKVVRGLRLGLTTDAETAVLSAPEVTAGPMLGCGPMRLPSITVFAAPCRALWYAQRSGAKGFGQMAMTVYRVLSPWRQIMEG